MRCHRCRGLMIVDSYIDMETSDGPLCLRAWRCVNCGEVAEPGIMMNRITQSSPAASDGETIERHRPSILPAVSISTVAVEAFVNDEDDHGTIGGHACLARGDDPIRPRQTGRPSGDSLVAARNGGLRPRKRQRAVQSAQ
jgi:hypothetical protein